MPPFTMEDCTCIKALHNDPKASPEDKVVRKVLVIVVLDPHCPLDEHNSSALYHHDLY